MTLKVPQDQLNVTTTLQSGIEGGDNKRGDWKKSASK